MHKSWRDLHYTLTFFSFRYLVVRTYIEASGSQKLPNQRKYIIYTLYIYIYIYYLYVYNIVFVSFLPFSILMS